MTVRILQNAVRFLERVTANGVAEAAALLEAHAYIAQLVEKSATEFPDNRASDSVTR